VKQRATIAALAQELVFAYAGAILLERSQRARERVEMFALRSPTRRSVVTWTKNVQAREWPALAELA
jgi:hypothetical protein